MPTVMTSAERPTNRRALPAGQGNETSHGFNLSSWPRVDADHHQADAPSGRSMLHEAAGCRARRAGRGSPLPVVLLVVAVEAPRSGVGRSVIA
jgi:hypothetical protein